MKKIMGRIAAFVLLIFSVFAFSACSADVKDVAGKYELLSVASVKIKFADFEYCYLYLNEDGTFRFEYELKLPAADGESSEQKAESVRGKFSIKNKERTQIYFDSGVIKGTQKIGSYRVETDFPISEGIECKLILLLSDVAV